MQYTKLVNLEHECTHLVPNWCEPNNFFQDSKQSDSLYLLKAYRNES